MASSQLRDVVAQAHADFGRLEIIINNAGYALAGAMEEASEDEVRAQFEIAQDGARINDDSLSR